MADDFFNLFIRNFNKLDLKDRVDYHQNHPDVSFSGYKKQKLKEIENAEMMRLEPAIERYRFASSLMGKFIHDLPKRVLSSYLRISEKQLSRLLVELAHDR